ncbi:hypothetical protein [Burkholderia vietnamiensis]|uniref:hypothetical protein n=1 Tax=Burkholderia vietnamiensis TaxID=60552 RepID=UPI000759F6B2|nr:hypothetical protein [Burkholderia vietnamiensis]
MTTNTYGGYTVDQLREFIRHHYDAEHGGDNIDELTNDSSASVKIVRDLLDAVEPQQDGDLLRPIARWVYNAVRVNLDLLHGICSEFGCPQGEDVATWLRARLAGVPAPRMRELGIDQWQPISTAPTDVLVVVFWLDGEDEQHPERYDFDMIEDDCWTVWTSHYEWAHSVAPAGSRLPPEQPPYTHWKPLGTPVRAAERGESDGPTSHAISG